MRGGQKAQAGSSAPLAPTPSARKNEEGQASPLTKGELLYIIIEEEQNILFCMTDGTAGNRGGVQNEEPSVWAKQLLGTVLPFFDGRKG